MIQVGRFYFQISHLDYAQYVQIDRSQGQLSVVPLERIFVNVSEKICINFQVLDIDFTILCPFVILRNLALLACYMELLIFIYLSKYLS